LSWIFLHIWLALKMILEIGKLAELTVDCPVSRNLVSAVTHSRTLGFSEGRGWRRRQRRSGSRLSGCRRRWRPCGWWRRWPCGRRWWRPCLRSSRWRSCWWGRRRSCGWWRRRWWWWLSCGRRCRSLRWRDGLRRPEIILVRSICILFFSYSVNNMPQKFYNFLLALSRCLNDIEDGLSRRLVMGQQSL